MPSPKLFIKDTPLRKLKVDRHPWIRLAMVCVGMVEGECKTFCMGTAINMFSMEDIGNLCREPLTGKVHLSNVKLSLF